jgi:GT2 family glycosyltransferase
MRRLTPLTLAVATAAGTSAEQLELTRRSATEGAYAVAEVVVVDADDPATWNDAMRAATTPWFAVVAAGARLRADALPYLARTLRTSDEAVVVYTDEAVRVADETEPTDVFKPGWSPRLALEGGYVGGVCAVRGTAALAAGGYSTDDTKTGGLDLVFRLADTGAAVEHVPVVALDQPDSVQWPTTYDAEGRAAGERISRAALTRRGLTGGIEPRAVWQQVTLEGAQPGVSIVIPTRDRVNLLRDCIASLEAHTDYPEYEIIVLDNDSVEPETLEYLAQLPHRVVPHPGAFNFSDLMNAGAAAARHPLLLLLNNDCTVSDPSWLSVMVSELADPSVGVVGCLLLTSDGTPQHEGVGLGLRGAAALNIEFFGYCHFDEAARDVIAVTAACVLVPKRVFDEVGGFDHELAVGFGDVDFCLRVVQAGHRIVYTPHAVVRHIGMATRREDPHRDDDALFASRWPLHRARQLDPFLNPRIEVFSPLWVTPAEAVLGCIPAATDA